MTLFTGRVGASDLRYGICTRVRVQVTRLLSSGQTSAPQQSERGRYFTCEAGSAQVSSPVRRVVHR